jgi:hypothetical protein
MALCHTVEIAAYFQLAVSGSHIASYVYGQAPIGGYRVSMRIIPIGFATLTDITHAQ